MNLDHDYNNPSKRKSLACVDYIPAICIHHLSLLLIEWLVRSSDWSVYCVLIRLEWFQIIEISHWSDSYCNYSHN